MATKIKTGLTAQRGISNNTSLDNLRSLAGQSKAKEETSNTYDPIKLRDNYAKRMVGSGQSPTKYIDSRNFIEKGLNLPENQNLFLDLLEIIGRPQQALFGAIDSAQYGSNALEGAWEGLTGKKDTSGGQLLRNAGMSDDAILGNKWGIGFDDVLGFGLDVLADPADLALFGAGKVAKGASKGIDVALDVADAAHDTLKVADSVNDTLKATKSGLELAKETVEGAIPKIAEMTAEEATPTLMEKIAKNFAISKDKYSLTDWYFNRIAGTAKSGVNVADEALGRMFELLDKANLEKGVSGVSWSDLYKGAKSTGKEAFNSLKALPKEVMESVTKELSMYKNIHGRTAMIMKTIDDETLEFAKKTGLNQKELYTVLMRELEMDTSRTMSLLELTPTDPNLRKGFEQAKSAFRWTAENEELVKTAYDIGFESVYKGGIVEPQDVYRVITSKSGEKFMLFTPEAGDYLNIAFQDNLLSFDRVNYERYTELYNKIASTEGFPELLDSVGRKKNLINQAISSYVGIPTTEGYVHRAITNESLNKIKQAQVKYTDAEFDELQGLIGKTKQFSKRKYAGDAIEANAQVSAVFDDWISTKVAGLSPEDATKFIEEHQFSRLFEEDLFSSMADYITKYPENIRDMRTVVGALTTSMFKDMNVYDDLLGAQKEIDGYYRKANALFKNFSDPATGELVSPEQMEAVLSNLSNSVKSKGDELISFSSKSSAEIASLKNYLQSANEEVGKLQSMLEKAKGEKKINSLTSKLQDAQLRVDGFEKQLSELSTSASETLALGKDELRKLKGQESTLKSLKNWADNTFPNMTRAQFDDIVQQRNLVREQLSQLSDGALIKKVSPTHHHNPLKDKLYSGRDFKSRLSKINEVMQSPEIDTIIKGINEAKNYTVDKRITRFIESNHYQTSNLFLKMFDKFTGMFKSMKLLNPSFNVRNTMGIYTNLYLSGMSNGDIGKYMLESQKLFSKQDEVMEKFIQLNADLLARGNVVDDVLSSNFVTKVAPEDLLRFGITDDDVATYQKLSKFIEAGFNRADPVSAMAKNFNKGVGSAVGADFKESFSQSIDQVNKLAEKFELAKASGNKVSMDIAKQALDKANYGLNKTIMYNMYANEYMDSLGRMAVMLKGMEDSTYLKNMGMPDVESAIRFVMFDPYELSDFEKKVMRRVMPFYNFTKKNLVYQMANISNNGTQYHRMYKAIKGGYEMANVDPDELQDFKINQFYIPVPLGENGRYGVIKANLPMSELGEWVSDPVTKVLSSLNPLIKTPIELNTNKNLFTGDTISDFKGQKGQKIDSLFGVGIDRQQEYMIGSTGLDAPIGALKNLRGFIEGDNKSLGSFAESMGIYKEYDIEADRKAKAYDQLQRLEEAMKYYKQEGVDIKTLKQLQEEQQNTNLKTLKLKIGLNKK